MRVTIHQPGLLTYSGFWYKMAVSDAFVVSRHDQFQKQGYQRRVRMRGTWASHRLVGGPGLQAGPRVPPGTAAEREVRPRRRAGVCGLKA